MRNLVKHTIKSSLGIFGFEVRRKARPSSKKPTSAPSSSMEAPTGTEELHTGDDRIRSLINILSETRPSFHGSEKAGTQNWAIRPNVLHWMADNIQPGGRTLETGCGYSTLLFAALSHAHTVISPYPQEHAAIAQWGEQHSLPMPHVKFIAAQSQDVLPGLDLGVLDAVLIDGDHAFPGPFIDWYYTADHIAPSGLVIVDDTQLPTGAILRDFLRAEAGRWELVTEIGKTIVFRRLTPDPVTRGIPWTKQPYCNPAPAGTGPAGRS